jgi:signal transduction histidine kinase
VLSSDLAVSLPSVSGDRVQLQQVLLNLMMNAIEAMNECDINSRVLSVRTDRCESGVLAAVDDCGVGIAQAKIEQLFKPFHTTKSGGMGMGLAISKSIIESHGGKLWAESNEQGGATFKFTLPVTITS